MGATRKSARAFACNQITYLFPGVVKLDCCLSLLNTSFIPVDFSAAVSDLNIQRTLSNIVNLNVSHSLHYSQVLMLFSSSYFLPSFSKKFDLILLKIVSLFKIWSIEVYTCNIICRFEMHSSLLFDNYT